MRNLPTDHVKAAEDKGKEIVEVVGDAAGQLPHDLHLLSLAQLFLKAAAVCDVMRAYDDTTAIALLMWNRRGDCLNSAIALRPLVSMGRARSQARRQMSI